MKRNFTPKKCKVDGCDRPSRCFGMCGKHYQRVYKHGDPHYTKMPSLGLPLRDRLLMNCKTVGDCWEWTGAKNKGYGRIQIAHPERKSRQVHRVAYEIYIGPIPEGLTLDHLCRNKACFNPSHLEPVTAVENVLRGNNFSAINKRKTQCMHGHPFDKQNTAWDVHRGVTRRRCKACSKVNAKKRYELRKKFVATVRLNNELQTNS